MVQKKSIFLRAEVFSDRLGATVRKESAFDAERVTHIIHGKNEISEEELRVSNISFIIYLRHIL